MVGLLKHLTASKPKRLQSIHFRFTQTPMNLRPFPPYYGLACSLAAIASGKTHAAAASFGINNPNP